MLEEENFNLNEKLKEMQSNQETFDKDNIEKAMSLEEEIAYLRRHSEVEMTMLRDENAILRKEMDQLLQNYSKHQNTSPMR